MDGRSGMRAADADREATAERLRVALEEGRLGLHEYDERLVRAYGAKTYADLDAVVADLPGPAPAQRSAVVPAPPTPSPVTGDGGPVAGAARSRLLGLWTPWLRVAGIMVPIWVLVSIGSRDLTHFWPAWVLGPWGALLVMQSVGLIGGGHPRHPGRPRRRDRRGRR
ncbi:DUF1707 domain-containing protein [Micromonospora halotolerans]|uniref:DUF1707 domain-containing protein n=1 Tax=Micromonospora halotolerans TaxID=709879 RepID=A0ABZ0A5A0_9ACTN|nr:DUF1707 domain-containing protein [Micromonospora halotolerans]WNM42629.1 DUF1707 domain-containing protein [Micromonospora halotolerans]